MKIKLGGLSCAPWHGLYGACDVTCWPRTKGSPRGNCPRYQTTWAFYHTSCCTPVLRFQYQEVTRFYPLVCVGRQRELDSSTSLLPAHAPVRQGPYRLVTLFRPLFSPSQVSHTLKLNLEVQGCLPETILTFSELSHRPCSATIFPRT